MNGLKRAFGEKSKNGAIAIGKSYFQTIINEEGS